MGEDEREEIDLKRCCEAFQELIGAYLSYGYLETKANEDFNNLFCFIYNLMQNLEKII